MDLTNRQVKCGNVRRPLETSAFQRLWAAAVRVSLLKARFLQLLQDIQLHYYRGLSSLSHDVNLNVFFLAVNRKREKKEKSDIVRYTRPMYDAYQDK